MQQAQKPAPVVVVIEHDEHAENPYRAFDTAGTLVVNRPTYGGDRDGTWLRTERARIMRQHPDSVAVVLPVYVYTSRHSDGGAHVVDNREDANAYVWGTVVGSGCSSRTQLAEVLASELAEYDRWAEGCVYFYSIQDEDGTVLDACGGFYGDDGYVQEEAETMRAWHDAERLRVWEEDERAAVVRHFDGLATYASA